MVITFVMIKLYLWLSCVTAGFDLLYCSEQTFDCCSLLHQTVFYFIKTFRYVNNDEYKHKAPNMVKI